MRIALATLVATWLVAGCGGAAPDPETGLDPGLYPGSFVGVLPCADCEGIEARLDLFEDGGYIQRLIYLGRSVEPFWELGSWRRDGSTVQLQDADGPGQRFAVLDDDELRLLDGEGRPIESELNYTLTRVEATDRLEPHLKTLRGMYFYLADANLFVECGSGWRMPVDMSGDNLALERAYLAQQPQPAQPMLVELDAKIAWMPPMEGDGLVPTVVPLEFLGIFPRETCGARYSPADLQDTYWKLTRIDGESAEVPGTGREPRLTLLGDGRYKAFDGCNRIVGSYDYGRGGDIEIRPGAATKMACQDVGEQAQRFSLALAEAKRWRIGGQHLELLDDRGLVLMRFEAVALK